MRGSPRSAASRLSMLLPIPHYRGYVADTVPAGRENHCLQLRLRRTSDCIASMRRSQGTAAATQQRQWQQSGGGGCSSLLFFSCSRRTHVTACVVICESPLAQKKNHECGSLPQFSIDFAKTAHQVDHKLGGVHYFLCKFKLRVIDFHRRRAFDSLSLPTLLRSWRR